jgi:hypothetical protein
MTLRCEPAVSAMTGFPKAEPIPRAQPIKAKRRGCVRGIGEDFLFTRFQRNQQNHYPINPSLIGPWAERI